MDFVKFFCALKAMEEQITGTLASSSQCEFAKGEHVASHLWFIDKKNLVVPRREYNQREFEDQHVSLGGPRVWAK